MKLSFSDLLVPAIIVGALGWWGYTSWSDHVAKNNAELARQTATAEYQRAVGAMAAQHSATPALTDKLAQAGQVYTYTVQNALLAATGRAVTFGGVIVDIEKRDNAYVLHLDDASAGPPAIRYVLECDAATLQKVTGIHATPPGVMIAAVITSVEKAEFDPAAPNAATRFVAKGRCLELVAR